VAHGLQNWAKVRSKAPNLCLGLGRIHHRHKFRAWDQALTQFCNSWATSMSQFVTGGEIHNTYISVHLHLHKYNKHTYNYTTIRSYRNTQTHTHNTMKYKYIYPYKYQTNTIIQIHRYTQTHKHRHTRPSTHTHTRTHKDTNIQTFTSIQAPKGLGISFDWKMAS